MAAFPSCSSMRRGRKGLEVVVAAIKEETDPEIDRRAEADSGITVHWLSLGELSRLIETFKNAGVAKAVMAGQVKHKQIFSQHPARLASRQAAAQLAHPLDRRASRRDSKSPQ